MRRFTLALILFLVLFLVSATPAFAHAGSGGGSTNYKVILNGIQPSISGLEVSLVERSYKVELRATGEVEAVVLGFGGEPYLRVGPSGAYENVRSESKILNQSTSPLPSKLEVSGEIDWKKISDEPAVSWHDRRANYGESNKPQGAQGSSSSEYVVLPQWEVPILVGDSSAAITGSVNWVPGPNPVGKFLASAVIALAVAVLMFTRRWRAALVSALTLLMVVDLQHSLLIALRKETTAEILTELVAGFYALAGWAMAIAAILYVFRSEHPRREDALFFAMLSAVILGFVGGFADIADLYRSQLAVFGPEELTRWSVTLTVGLSCGVVLGSAARLAQARGQVEQSR